MAFANIFTRLTAIDEDVSNPCESALAHRKLGEQEKNAKGDHARKKKICGEEKSGSNTKGKKHKQMQFHQAKTTETHNAPTSSKEYDSKAINYHRENSERASVCFTEELDLYIQSSKTDQNNMDTKIPNFNNKNTHTHNNQKQQQQQPQKKKKKKKKKKNQHGQIDGGGAANRRGGYIRDSSSKGRMNKGGKQDVPVERKRVMTQEFQDQNALVVDGRLLCRHFLCGRCIKGDDCQLEHVQGVNDLIKEVCKFYVQKFCMKGESCPYMHNSFPCKFFHSRGKCAHGAECRFSHEPLTDLTKKLLDEAIKRDNELNEIATKAQQDASVQPKNKESLITEENTVDILLHPIRPNFYNSSCPSEPHAEKETVLCQTEGLADIIKDAVTPHATDATRSHSPPSSNLSQKELVSYSVEAVLGIQKSKPFPSLFATPLSRESTTTHSSPQTSLACPSNSANQSEVPYSVFDPQEVPDSMSSSASQNEKVAYSVNTASESNKPLEKIFKNLSSSQVHACHISTFASSTKASIDLPLTSGGRQEQNGDIPESQKPTKIPSQEVKLGLSHPASMLLENSKSSKTQADRRGLFVQTSSPRYVTNGTRHLAGDITSLQDSTELRKSRDTVLASSDCRSKGVLPVGPTKPTQRAFHSLFSCPPSQNTVPKCPTQLKSHHSCMPSGRQDSVQSPHPSSTSTDCKSAVEPGKAPTRSFLSLFASPISETSAPPCIPTKPDSPRTSSYPQVPDQSADSVSHSGHCKRRASNLETSFTGLFSSLVSNDLTGTLPVPRSPYSPPRSKRKRGNHSSSAECINKSPEQLVKPACSLTSDSVSEMSTSQIHNDTSRDPSTTQAQQQLPDASSHKASSKATTINSTLKTLFLSLSPYCQDGKQQDNIQTNVPLESENDNNGTGCVLTERQLKRGEEKREEVERIEEELKEERMLRDEHQLKTQDSYKQSAKNTVAHPNPAEHQPSPQNQSHTSLEVTGGLTSRCPGMRQAQVRTYVNLPVQPVAPLMRLHTQPTLKQSSGQKKCVNGNVGLKPLKDLFKNLDPSASPFGK